MTTSQANQLGIALTRLAGQPVYVERCDGSPTAEVFTGTLVSFRRGGNRRMTMTLQLRGVTFAQSLRREREAAGLEVEVDLSNTNPADINGASIQFTTKAAHFTSYTQRCDIKFGTAAEQHMPTSVPAPA